MPLYPFNVKQTYPFPELVYWCSKMYCHTTYILQNHRRENLICAFTPQSIRAILGLPEELFMNFFPFSEITMIDLFKSYDPRNKGQFLKVVLKPDIDVQSLKYPCLTSSFINEIQIVFSLLSQVLGLDHDREVSEAMPGFLMVYYEVDSSKGQVTVAFDEFLSDSINGQFANFQFLQKFRYSAYLVKFIIDFNLSEL